MLKLFQNYFKIILFHV